MKTIFAMLTLVFLSHGALAGEDPRFTWQMAEREFAGAENPTATELIGQWLYVGMAMEGNTKYYPDGRYFYDLGVEANHLTTITDMGKDAKGVQNYHMEAKVVILADGSEKNKKEHDGFAAATFARFLYSKFERNQKQNSVSCEVHQDCRVTGDRKYLVCAFVTTKDRDCVKHWPTPYAYLLLMRK